MDHKARRPFPTLFQGVPDRFSNTIEEELLIDTMHQCTRNECNPTECDIRQSRPRFKTKENEEQKPNVTTRVETEHNETECR